VKGLVVFLLALSAAQALTLVDKGRSKHTIVISAQASRSEQRAAHELQRFVEEMSGARLPVSADDKPVRGPLVLVGDSAALRNLKVQVPFDQLGPEGFVLQAAGNNIIIAGGRQRGTMYGVYTFLDQLGCRWFTREVSRIPKTPTITVTRYAQPEIHKPAFEYREPFFFEAWDKDWAARNRTNGNHSQLDASTGGKLQYYPFVHSFYELVPPKEYFAGHPEYFSLIDGKRRTERGQLCLTNPDVLRVVIARVEAWIKEHPDATIFSVSQNDWEGWCECDRCRRVEMEEGGQHSGPLLRFVNAVAESIGQRHPDKLIDTLAYWYTENPPLKVRPVKNVRIRLCPIGICVSHSFGQCPRSAYFYQNLQAWSKITNQLYIWHYNTNFSHYPMPFPDFDELAADIPLYKQHGVVGLFMQGAYAAGGGGEASELRAYVLARQLWDASTNVDQTVQEFLEGVYGAAAGPMRAYYDLLHSEVRGPGGRHLWIFNVPDYSAGFQAKAAELFAKAEAAAADDATRRRVQKAKLPLEYYGLLRATEFDVHGSQWGPADLASLKPRALDLIARMRTFGIQSIHEGQELARDEKRYNEMTSVPLLTIENGQWRADVVPELNARVVRLIDKSTGRDTMRRYPPGEGAYPFVGGQVASVHADYYAKTLDVTWIVDSQSTERLVLLGQCANGLRIRRAFELNAAGLHTSTIVENAGQAPVPAALQVRAEYTPGDIDKASMSFTRINGQRVEQPFITPNHEPTDKYTWNGGDKPSREWKLQQGGGQSLYVRFQDEQVGRTYLNWTAKSRAGAQFLLWSPEKTLKPGESLKLEADYGAVRP
jgi:hypothetical protein